MYVPNHFRESRVPVLHAAIRQIKLASLVTTGPAGIEASQAPLLIDPDPAPFGTLRGHLARANPQARPGESFPALAIFLGPNAYVTPSWYATKRESGKVVPTWNYIAVHAYGTVTFTEDQTWLRDFVGRLTDTHEAARAKPWAVTDAPDDYIRAMLKAIVGFELVIDRLDGKWKMSQNRPAEDRAGVEEGLARDGGAPELSDIMGALERERK